MLLRNVTLGACLALLAGCSSNALRPVCLSDSDCSGGRCVDQRCEPAPHDTLPPPLDLASCDEPCGSICCPGGMECRNAECVPECASGLWCGSLIAQVCCAQGQRCDGHACLDPEPPPHECPDGEVFDEDLGACLGEMPVHACQRPQTGFFDAVTLWEVSPDDGYNQVITTPVVIDVNGDGAADVIAPFFSEAIGFDKPAVLRALSGIDGRELWHTQATQDGIAGITQLAAIVPGAGLPPVIVGVDEDARLSAFRGDNGERLWRSRAADGTAVACNIGWGAPAIADLDGDARPELVCGFTVFDSAGVMKWSGPEAFGPLGPIVALADLDGDGKVDLTDGRKAFRHDGKLLWSEPDDQAGLAAVADLVGAFGVPGLDGRPELVVTRLGTLELRDGRTGMLLAAPYLLPTWDGYACWSHPSSPGIGGAPSLGDVDGDGIPEVVVASGECLTALQLMYDGGWLKWRMLWGAHAVDESSSVTGVALFDFDANGWLDVVHADETVLHLNEGSHGAPKYEAAHCSGTIYEEPVVADVDGDGSANIVLARNGIGRAGLGCAPSVKPGIVVLRERRSRWANARAIWNQHGYVAPYVCDGMDGVCDDLGPVWGAYGRVTMAPPPPWEYSEPGAKAPYNGSRANTAGGYGPTATADAVITHVLQDDSACPEELRVRVRVVNTGEAPLRPGTQVALVRFHGEQVAIAHTDRPLPPGESTLVSLSIPPTASGTLWSLRAVVDPDDATAECDEANNAFGPVKLACPLIAGR